MQPYANLLIWFLILLYLSLSGRCTNSSVLVFRIALLSTTCYCCKNVKYIIAHVIHNIQLTKIHTKIILLMLRFLLSYGTLQRLNDIFLILGWTIPSLYERDLNITIYHFTNIMECFWTFWNSRKIRQTFVLWMLYE